MFATTYTNTINTTSLIFFVQTRCNSKKWPLWVFFNNPICTLINTRNFKNGRAHSMHSDSIIVLSDSESSSMIVISDDTQSDTSSTREVSRMLTSTNHLASSGPSGNPLTPTHSPPMTNKYPAELSSPSASLSASSHGERDPNKMYLEMEVDDDGNLVRWVFSGEKLQYTHFLQIKQL